MKNTALKIAGSAVALAIATPALAHDGDHSVSFVANVMHWLSSPTHSLFAVIGGVAFVALLLAARKKRA